MGYWAWETRYDSKGSAYQQPVLREVRMPRIDDTFLYCVVYLYDTEKHAMAGVRTGGSGFLLGIPCGCPEPINAPTAIGPKPYLGSWDTPHIYAVTNAHVIDDGNLVLRFNTNKGDTAIRITSEKDWFRHPEADIAVCPLGDLGYGYEMRIISPHVMMTAFEADLLHVGIGDELAMIGRFINSEGRQRNSPVARFGHISAMPGEPISVKRPAGLKKIPPQESILGETHSLPGYSGSPVFLVLPSWELHHSEDFLRREIPKTEPVPLHHIRLLGITWGFIYGNNLPIKAGRHRLPGFMVEEVNTGMMAAVPAWKLFDVLNMKELAALRQEEAERWGQGGEGGAC